MLEVEISIVFASRVERGEAASVRYAVFNDNRKKNDSDRWIHVISLLREKCFASSIFLCPKHSRCVGLGKIFFETDYFSRQSFRYFARKLPHFLRDKTKRKQSNILHEETSTFTCITMTFIIK